MDQQQDSLRPRDGESAASACVLRDPRPGDLGFIVHRQALLYWNEYGWDAQFEALLAEIAAKFLRDFQPGRERCWIAERAGEIVGAVLLVEKSRSEAQLRLLYVEPRARGSGLGKRLIGACVDFARTAGYESLVLWTDASLHAARHLYEAAGFERVDAERHRSFGHDLVGEHWRLELGRKRD